MVDLQDDVVRVQAGVGGRTLVQRRHQHALFVLAQVAALFVAEVGDGNAQARIAVLVHGGDRLGGGFEPGDGGLDFQRFAVAQDGHGHGLAHRRHADHPRQLRGVLDRFAAVAQDHIALLEAGAGRRAVWQDLRHQRAARSVELERLGQIVVDRLQQHAEPAAGDLAGRLHLLDDLYRQLDGNGERQPHVAAGAAVNLRVDADHLAAQVEQGAAGTAGVDRDIALDERHVGAAGQVAAHRADDALGGGVLQPERRADGQHPFAHLQRVGVADLHRLQVLALDLEQRHVGQVVDADDLGRPFPLVAEPDDDLVGVLGDMRVRQDVAVRREDEARSQGIGLAFAGQFRALLEEALEELQIGILGAGQFRQAGGAGRALAAGRLGGTDIDDGRLVLLDQLAKIWQRLRFGGTRRGGDHPAQRCQQREQLV